ncbi:MAG: DHA2 family efflux MFS transporter permease subunit [Methylacidiphilales bacterium]|nr:DHA2 family efflux MFS transporter permease subunit [Candidatus Methylacidiphilales bacterium]
MSVAAASGALAGAPARARAINPWIVAVVVTMATFMEILDTTIANVALPHIAGGLSSGIDESTWILTSYLVANAVVLPLSAWLSRYFGRKRYYMTCVALFTASSFLCGLAPSLGLLIFFRVLQGIGGGGLAPCEQAILVDTFPAAKRAGAFALYSMAIVTAPAIGPTLGGWITDHFNWRWVFYINVPIGLLSLFLTQLVVTDSDRMKEEMRRTREAGAKIDFVGILLVAVAFGCLEVVLDKGQRDDWFESNFIVTFLVISLTALATGIWWELTVKDPVVDLTLLRERNFALSNFFYFMFGFVLIGSTVLIPQMLQGYFGYTAYDSGWAVSPAAFIVVFMAPLVVKFIFPALGATRLIFLSFILQAVALWHFSALDLTADYDSFLRARLIQGFGIAFLFIPVSSLAYSYLPKELNNKASSLTNLFRNLGSSFGIAFVTTMQARRAQVHQNFLIEHLSVGDPAVNARLNTLATTFRHGGYTSFDAIQHAEALLANTMSNQANILAFLDVFWVLGWISVISALVAFFIRPFNPRGGPVGG